MIYGILLILLGMSMQNETGFIIFSIGIVIALVSSNKPMKSIENNKNESFSCPPHRWTDSLQNGLVCDICKRKPGEISTDYDKPY